jgi:hypothetical protein
VWGNIERRCEGDGLEGKASVLWIGSKECFGFLPEEFVGPYDGDTGFLLPVVVAIVTD